MRSLSLLLVALLPACATTSSSVVDDTYTTYYAEDGVTPTETQWRVLEVRQRADALLQAEAISDQNTWLEEQDDGWIFQIGSSSKLTAEASAVLQTLSDVLGKLSPLVDALTQAGTILGEDDPPKHP